MTKEIPIQHIGPWETSAHGHLSLDSNGDETTDYSRWRLHDEKGRQTWKYLESDEENEKWKQSIYDKYFLGLDTGLPNLPTAKSPLQAAKNGISFLTSTQLPSGQWATDCGGINIVLPSVVIGLYVTNTPIPPPHAIELKRYLFSIQNPHDHGWGWHVEGHSSNIGTSLTYVVLRLLGVSREDERMVKARGFLMGLGGAVYAPSLVKHWLSVLGVMEWSCVNPFLPELWLVPETDPTAPWQWFVGTRINFLPMAYLWSKKWSYPLTETTKQLREELYTRPYHTINFFSHRDSIAPTDNDTPKKFIVNLMNFLMVWIYIPLIRLSSLIKRGEEKVWKLVQAEDKNTFYTGLNPICGAMNLIVCFAEEGEGSESVRLHRERILTYFWMGRNGMLCNVSDGVQSWDTANIIQSIEVVGLGDGDGKTREVLGKALGFLEDHQVGEDAPFECYRGPRKGGWALSTKYQGYIVSECVSEALRSVLLLQEVHQYPKFISEARMKDAIGLLLHLQNEGGGWGVYEKRRGGYNLEKLEAAEFGGKALVSYDYVECTTSSVTGLIWFGRFFPEYRKQEIAKAKREGLEWIKNAQDKEGGWCAAWCICYTYGAMWTLETLALTGENYETSEYSKKGCEFLIGKQKEDGGWGESWLSSVKGTYVQHESSQVVQTAWACLALMYAGYPDKQPIREGIKLLMMRQQVKGDWLQEGIEGSLAGGTMSYGNYKLYWPVRALGLYVKTFDDEELL